MQGFELAHPKMYINCVQIRSGEQAVLLFKKWQDLHDTGQPQDNWEET